MRKPPPPKQKGKATGARRLNGEILDASGVKELLGAKSEKIVYARAARGLLPHRRWGGRLIFLKEEIITFLKALPGTTVQEAVSNSAERQP